MNVFISWRSTERELKNKIVARLREDLDGIDNVWESDADCASDFSEDCIAAIRQSQVFVVLVSDSTMGQSYVTNEVVEAHECELAGKLNMVVYKLTDTPYSPKLAGHLNHISDVHHLARAAGKPDDASISPLVLRVKSLLKRRKEGNPEKPADVMIPLLEGVGVGENDYFVPESRVCKLAELEEALSVNHAVFISGLKGYGKKALVRQYARLHKEDYDTVISLPFFRGSLREFFLNGIHITNLNESVFDDLNEDQLILKKASFLKKLDKRTLIIVPELTVGKKDDAFILDILADLSCHILFVAHTLTAGISGKFPTVHLDRMENRYLRELFFYHYAVDDEEQLMLTPSLDLFFDSIDGHTGAVEITATALSEELGIYPEDIPEILEKIRPDSDNPLADRIFGLISDLFDLNRFSEGEKKILYTASILARVPMDEKAFLSILKEGGFYDADAIRKLSGQRWLILDRKNRTVSIDSLLSEVCFSRIPADDGVILTVAEDLAANTFRTSSQWVLSVELEQIETLFNLLKLSDALYLSGLLRTVLLDVSEPFTDTLAPDNLSEYVTKATDDVETLTNERLRAACDILIRQIYASLQSAVSLYFLSRRTDKASLNESAFFSFINDEFLNTLLTVAYNDDFEDLPLGSEFAELVSAIISKNRTSVIGAYEKLCLKITETDYDDEPEFFMIVGLLVMPIGAILIQSHLSDTRLTLFLCRNHSIPAKFFGFPSPGEAYLYYSAYFNALTEAREFTEEMDTVFNTLVELVGTEAGQLFKSMDEAQLSYVLAVTNYACTRYLIEDYEAGDEVLDRVNASKLTEIQPIQSYLDGLDKLTEIALAGGCPSVATALLEKRIPEITEAVTATEEDPDGELHLTLSTLSDILHRLKDPTASTEDARPYLSYYEEYAKEEPDQKKYRLFCSIAKKTQAIDLSSLSAEELKDKVKELKARAASGVKESTLAPEAFALVSEAGYRILGFRHHYVQYLGGMAIAEGMIAEMQNGEGKTYTILLAAFLHTLYRRQVHILDSSPYLSARNFANMRGVLEYLGCTVGLVTMDNNGKPDEWSHCDVLYGSLAAMSFARLKNERQYDPDKRRTLRFDVIIADEADYALVDEGNMPCILTGDTVSEDLSLIWGGVYRAVRELHPDDHEYFEYNKITYRFALKEKLYRRIEACLGTSIATLSISTTDYLNKVIQTALTVFFRSERDRNYFVINGECYYENKAKGELYLPDPMWRYFLYRKEGLNDRLTAEELQKKEIMNRATVFDLIREYQLISGTTATARSVKSVFKEIYGVEVMSIPTNQPIRRIDHEPVLLIDKATKETVLLRILENCRCKGQPVIIIAPGIPEANDVSHLLSERNIPHALLTAINSEKESELLGQAGTLGAVTVTTAMANRGVDVMLGGNPFTMAKNRLTEMGYSEKEINDAIYRIQGLNERCKELRERYLSLTAYYRSFTAREKSVVEALGGLCVIGTECFRDPRVEQQLRGRAGRQGIIGESYILYSLDDPSVQSMAPTASYLQEVYRSTGTEAIDSSMLMRALAKARKTMQEKHLIRLAEEPLSLYFKDAHRILVGSAERLVTKKETTRTLFEKVILKNKPFLKSLLAYLKDRSNAPLNHTFNCVLPFVNSAEGLNESKLSAILENALAGILQSFKAAGNVAEDPLITPALSLIQKGWVRFIELMDGEIASANTVFVSNSSKKKSYLLNYAKTQASRLLEYQLFRLLSVAPRPQKPQNPQDGISTKPLPSQVRTVGRNDPCPCGSGMKYKNCCGKPGNGK